MIRYLTIAIMSLYIAATWVFTYTGYKQFAQSEQAIYSQEDRQSMDLVVQDMSMPPRIDPVGLPKIAGIN